MSEKTKIAWCDSTVNFWEGCTKVSAGCANCYAEARDKRFTGGAHWGKGAPRRKSKSAVKDALRLNRLPWICNECGRPSSNAWVEALTCCECLSESFHRRRIFSLSLGDWLDPEAPVEWLAEMLDTIRQCDQVNWILCTKRPELWGERMTMAIGSDLRREAHGKQFNDWLSAWTRGHAPQNVCVLASVENQKMAEARIPALLRIPACWHGLSCEPLLGPLWLPPIVGADFRRRMPSAMPFADGRGIDWLIIGGESGKNVSPCNVEWIRSLVRQCETAGVVVFCKQLGSYPLGDLIQANGGLLDKKGANPDEWPSDLRIQQWPEGL